MNDEQFATELMRLIKRIYTFFCVDYEGFTAFHKTYLWFGAVNPQLGDVTPLEMIYLGRIEKLSIFIDTQLDENQPHD